MEMEKSIPEQDQEQVSHDGYNVAHLTDLGIKLEAIEDKIIVLIDDYKSGYECKDCAGTGKISVKSNVVEGAMREETCSVCRGQGALIIIPQIAKSLPSSGVVISLGEKCLAMAGLKNAKIQLGARIVFSPHVGTFIPFKGNIKLKIMREHEPLCVMYGADSAARDFMEFETELN